MSGAKKASARESIAMRAPSRQTTATLIAGGAAPAAIERARSAMTNPSAPSATPASNSGRPVRGAAPVSGPAEASRGHRLPLAVFMKR